MPLSRLSTLRRQHTKRISIPKLSPNSPHWLAPPMPRKNPSRSWLCVLRQPTEEQRVQLQAKASDRAIVFRAGLLTIEGGGLQAWFAARHPNKLEVMKVRAAWMQTNILDVG